MVPILQAPEHCTAHKPSDDNWIYILKQNFILSTYEIKINGINAKTKC
jgi:hypothetical protein